MRPLAPRICALVITTAVAGFAGGAAFAEDNLERLMRMSLDDLMRVRISSVTRGVALESDVVPANVIVIERDEIEANDWRSIGEVLQHVPGLYLIDDLVYHTVSVRGITGGLRSGARIIKVMLNGVEVSFHPDLSALLGPEFIPMIAVSRIEVARGPHAFLATVNVITREPAALGLALSLRGAWRAQPPGQSHGGAGLSGLVSRRQGQFGLLVSAGYDRIDEAGLAIEKTYPAQNNPSYAAFFADRSQHDLSRPLSLFAQASAHTARAGSFTLQGGLQRRDSGGEFQVNSVLSHRSRYTLLNLWSNLAHVHRFCDWLSSSLSVGYAQGSPTDDERLFLTGDVNHWFRRNVGYRAGDFKASGLLTWGPQLQLSLGVDGTSERHRALYYSQTFLLDEGTRRQGETVDLIAPSDQIDIDLWSVGPFVELTSAPLPDLQLVANARVDHTNLFGALTSWRLAAARRFHRDWVAKLIVGEAFQTPSTTLMFAKPGFGVAGNIVGSQTLPVPALRPQTVRSAELVLSALPASYLSLVASSFVEEIRDKIEFVAIGLGFRARNRATERLWGGEITGRISLSRVLAFAGATRQWSLAQEAPPDSSTDAPSLYPSYWILAGLRVALPEARFNLQTTVRRVGLRGASQSNEFLNGGRYALPSYTLVDLVARSLPLDFGLAHSETNLTLGVRNLLNATWSEPGFGGIDIPSSGRTVTVSLSQTY